MALKRRQFTLEFKPRVLQEADWGKSVSQTITYKQQRRMVCSGISLEFAYWG